MFEKKFLYRSKDGPRIIIIGAGVAGVAAASRLIRNGYNNIKIIEAEGRIGGRVHSVPLKDTTVDLGAHWVHGAVGNAVFELAEPYKLVNPSNDFRNNIQFILSNGREIDSEVGMLLYSEASLLVDDTEALGRHNGSLYDYLTDKLEEKVRDKLFGDARKAFIDWMVQFECTIEGCDSLKEPSSKGLTHYKHCNGDSTMHWNGKGYKTIIDILLGTHKGSMDKPIDLTDKLLVNTEVEQIDYSGIGVLVKCKGGTSYAADFAILSVSLGVLKEKYKTMFYPSLPPEKRKSIIGLSIGTVDKVYLKFPYIWWPEDCSGFSLLWIKDDKSYNEKVKDLSSWQKEIIGFYPENSTPTTLTAWLVGEAAREMETCTLDQVKNGCYKVLKMFLSHKYDIPEPEAVVRSAWYSNPHFRGSYSFRSLKSEALNVSAATLAQPLKNSLGRDVLFFAGEATHDSFYSTVHGAIETGWREADHIIALDKKAMKSTLSSLSGHTFCQLCDSWGSACSFDVFLVGVIMLMGEEVTIPMPWGNIAGKAWGSNDGTPVLCIHGYNDNAASFDRLLTCLVSPHYYYLAIDLPGHGKSSHYPRNSQLSAIEFMADLRRICDHYGWTKITFLAHSVSSRLVLYYAAIFPKQVKMLIILDLAPGVILFESQHICDIVEHEVEGLIRNEKENILHTSGSSEEEAYEKYKESRTANLKDEYILPVFLRSIKKSGDLVYFSKDKRNTSIMLPLITSQFHEALISNVNCPTLILMSSESFGVLERIPTFTHTLDFVKKALKNKFTFIEINSSHDMHIEYPEKIAPIISGYITLKSKL